MLADLILKVLINPSATTTDLHCVLNAGRCHDNAALNSLIYCKVHCLGLPILRLVYSQTYRKSLKSITDCDTFFVFNRTTQIYLMRILITQQKPDVSIVFVY